MLSNTTFADFCFGRICKPSKLMPISTTSEQHLHNSSVQVLSRQDIFLLNGLRAVDN